MISVTEKLVSPFETKASVDAAQREDTGPAVIDGELQRTSVSAVQTFDPETDGGCNRKWHLEQVQGFKKPPTIAMLRGTEMHAQIEHYLKTGEDTRGMLARSGARFTPSPRGPGPVYDLLVEEPFGDAATVKAFAEARRLYAWHRAQWGNGVPSAKRTELDALNQKHLAARDVPFVGYIDLVNLRNHWLDDEGIAAPMDHGTREVGDWKTTKSIETWAKPAHKLADTIQMIGYGEYVARRWPDADRVRLSHGNFQTIGRLAEKRSALVSIDTIRKNWQRIETIVGRMIDVAKEASHLTVEPNWDACTSYGGCPHRDLCPRSAKQLYADVFKGRRLPVLPPNPLAKGRPVDGMFTRPDEGDDDLTLGFFKPGNVTDKEPVRMSLKEKLAAQRAATAAASQAQQTNLLPAAAEQPAPLDVTRSVEADAVAAEVARLKAAEKPSACAHCGETLTIQNSSTLTSGAKVHAGCRKAPAAVLPPDAPKSTDSTSADPVPPETLPTLSPELQAAAKVTADAVAANPPAEAAKRKGRPRGSTNKAKPAAETTGASPEAIAAAIEIESALEADASDEGKGSPVHRAVTEIADILAKASEADDIERAAIQNLGPRPDRGPAYDRRGEACGSEITAGPRGIVLFVDCHVESPHAGQIESLDGWIYGTCKALADSEQAADIRCAPEKGALGFGKWKGALSAALAASLPPPGLYSLDFVAESELLQVALAAIKPHCETFIRGRK